MRCEMRRAFGLACLLAAATAATATAGQWPWHHTIPRETPALDYRTGDVMQAPPIPYGEYAKDYVGTAYGAAATAAGFAHGLPGRLAGLCSQCGNKLCGRCGGLGNRQGNACGSCGGDGCSTCGSGLFGHGHGLGLGHGHGGGLLGKGCGVSGCNGRHGLGLGLGHGHGGALGGLGHSHGGGAALCGPGMNCASGQSPVVATGQAPAPSAQSAVCGACHGLGRLGNGACGLCGGRGLLGKLCGLCGGKGLGVGGPCGGCGGRGLLGKLCGLCGGGGRLANGSLCGACGSGANSNGNANTCRACGGKGCALCGGTGLIHALASHVVGTAAGLFHKGGVEYFVGPGGPVPLTPGYVPYIVPTRSPRDYFAFPPFSDQAQP